MSLVTALAKLSLISADGRFQEKGVFRKLMSHAVDPSKRNVCMTYVRAHHAAMCMNDVHEK